MSDELQFDSAEPASGSATAGATCANCTRPIADLYYENGGRTFCADCTHRIGDAFAPRFEAGRFARAALFGLGGAIGGAAVYFGVLAVTGYEVGLIAILAGFMVGWTVHRGAGGKTSRSYQVLAVALTYLAIGGTYMSYILKEIGSEPRATASASADSATHTESTPATGSTRVGPVRAMAMLIGLTLAIPMIYIFGGLPGTLISALIMFFALRQAWTMNRAPVVTFNGPYRIAATGAA